MKMQPLYFNWVKNDTKLIGSYSIESLEGIDFKQVYQVDLFIPLTLIYGDSEKMAELYNNFPSLFLAEVSHKPDTVFFDFKLQGYTWSGFLVTKGKMIFSYEDNCKRKLNEFYKTLIDKTLVNNFWEQF